MPLRVRSQPGKLGSMTERRLYLVCGLPGAGKTTRSHQIVEVMRAVHLCPDEWVVGLGVSLVDFEFRVRLQDCMLAHAARMLRCGVSVVIEFGSWSRAEREAIRRMAVSEGATVELQFLHAPLEELVRRVRLRGGPGSQDLVDVLLEDAAKFERPSEEEVATFDRYVGPDDEWAPG